MIFYELVVYKNILNSSKNNDILLKNKYLGIWYFYISNINININLIIMNFAINFFAAKYE